MRAPPPVQAQPQLESQWTFPQQKQPMGSWDEETTWPEHGTDFMNEYSTPLDVTSIPLEKRRLAEQIAKEIEGPGAGEGKGGGYQRGRGQSFGKGGKFAGQSSYGYAGQAGTGIADRKGGGGKGDGKGKGKFRGKSNGGAPRHS